MKAGGTLIERRKAEVGIGAGVGGGMCQKTAFWCVEKEARAGFLVIQVLEDPHITKDGESPSELDSGLPHGGMCFR